tara:strand:+ start:11636 stop:11998 length:363 start_codon:yes stop_codon:yes gene_type:complete
MGKAKHKMTNWSQYSKAFINRGSLTDEQAIQSWQSTKHHGRRGRGYTYSDVAIETALVIKGVFSLSLRSLEGFTNSVFQLMDVPMYSPSYSCISELRLLKLSIERQVVAVWRTLTSIKQV